MDLTGLQQFITDAAADARARAALDALVSGLQGVSNAAATTVTGPVDVIALLLGKAGVDVGPAPIGGEAWARQVGLMRDPSSPLAGAIGEGLGYAAAAMSPARVKGLLQK